jgi:hypothetical protein
MYIKSQRRYLDDVCTPVRYTLSLTLILNLNPINVNLLSCTDKVHTTDLSSVRVSLDPYPFFLHSFTFLLLL